MLVWPQIRRVTSLLRPLPKASRSADALVTLKHGETFTCVFENTRSWNRTLLSRFYVWRWTKCRLYCAELLCRAPTSGRNRNPACVLFFFFHFCTEGSGSPLLWRTVRTGSLTAIESHQLCCHAAGGGGAAWGHTCDDSGVNLTLPGSEVQCWRATRHCHIPQLQNKGHFGELLKSVVINLHFYS